MTTKNMSSKHNSKTFELRDSIYRFFVELRWVIIIKTFM